MDLKQTMRRCAYHVSSLISTTRNKRNITTASSLSSPALTLPQEIIDAIIDQLEGDVKSLTSASLVSLSWYSRTRDHLFRHVKLGERYPQTSSRRLHSLLHERPGLASYIKELTLVDNADPYAGRESWLRLCHYTVELLPFYTALTHLRIICKCGVDWTSLPAVLRDRLLDVMCRPTLIHLSLTRVVKFDFVAIAQLQHIRELHLESMLVEFDPMETETPCNLPMRLPSTPSTPGRRCLGRLSLIDCGDALHSLLRCSRVHVGLQGLLQPTDLVVGTHFDDSMRRAFPMFMDLCGSSIESYTVIQPFVDHICAGAFVFSQLPRLRDLTVIVTANSFIHNSFLLLDELNRLCNSPFPTPLSSFTLRLEVAMGGADRVLSRMLEYHAKVNASVWLKLDAMLSNSDGFPSLRKVTIEFGVSNCPFAPDSWERTQQRVLSQMSSLNASGKIAPLALCTVPPVRGGGRL